MRTKIITLFLILSFILTSGFGCKLTTPKTAKKMEPITIKYWRVFDGPDAFDDIIKKYNALHSFIKIDYKKFRYDEYEDALLNALAEDRGPDIFSIPSSWLLKYENKVAPMPASISMVYPVVKGSIKKEIVPEIKTVKSITLRELKNNFVATVYNDVLLEKEGKQRVYGLPLSVDALAMYYNRKLLNNAGITKVPEYWDRYFQQTVKKLTKQNSRGRLIQSGVSLGGSKNINNAADVLSLLMMQNGAIMQEGGRILFHTIPTGSDRKYNPGLEALRFYTDFSDAGKEVYCWNNTLGNSIDLFSQGSLAITFGYSYHLPLIKAKSPKLDFGVARVPQIKGSSEQINYANYWIEVVSAKSKHIDEAWDFIQFETKKEQVKSYLKATKRPTALRSLITEQIDDINLGPFAEEVLTAETWYHGRNPEKANDYMNELIDLTVKKEVDLKDILQQIVSKVQQTIQ